MNRLTKPVVVLILVGIAAIPAGFLLGKWRDASIKGGQKPAEPFLIGGNLYYVGANDATSFLITSDDGHILIDGGYPGNAKLIKASIKKLGYDIKDVKILLNTHPHFDHAGGLAELQQASGRVVGQRGGCGSDGSWWRGRKISRSVLVFVLFAHHQIPGTGCRPPFQ